MSEKPRRKTRDERFRVVAQRRTRRVIEQIRGLSRCSNRANYNYDGQQVSRIFKAIRRELDLAESQFTKKPAEEFEL